MNASRFLTLILLLLAASPLIAQDSLLTDAIRSNLYSLSIDGEQFDGTANNLLFREIANHQFILVGEQHGIQEVGQFTKVLFQYAAKRGFRYLALETDPWIATELESRSLGSVAGLKQFNKELPYTIPFYMNEEDFDFLHSVVNTTKAESMVFWGLDHVGGAAERYLFKKLVEIASSDKAKKLAQEYVTRGEEGIKKFLQTGNPKEGLLLQMQEADYKRLYEAFGTDEDSRSYKIISGMKQAQEIYLAWFDRKIYLNNFIRSQLMKKNFRTYYNFAKERDGKDPKVVFKFGSNHMKRGLNTTEVYDIGNMVSELAEFNGSRSLHIQFSAIKGTSDRAFVGAKPFDESKDIPLVIMNAISDKKNGSDWILIDFRPLRQIRIRNMSESLRELIHAYDMWVIVPEAKAVTAFPNQ